ncbi:MAG: hypothetical protein K2Q20_14670, partial [Phycisphaerales bacterium]|nr:hypothetical protein [Phycisphaerales bacterium]
MSYYVLVGNIPTVVLVGIALWSELRRLPVLFWMAIVLPAFGLGALYASFLIDLRIPSPPPPAAEVYADQLRQGLTPVVHAVLGSMVLGLVHLVIASAA